ncbi:acetoacetate decarboxylase family protein [Candidatus Poribacteria bacterium]|nr:acetoacetate decarboxylase family protein [Candidatus Poribacteria bacterium]
MKKEDFGHSTPVHAPLYPEGIRTNKRFELIQVLMKPNPEKAAALIPEPLEPEAEPLAAVIVANYRFVTNIGPYREAIVNITARYKGEPVAYTAYIYVDSDASLAGGRERFGHPKKMAELTLSQDCEVVRGTCTRRGFKIVDAAVCIYRDANMEHVLMRPLYQLKVVPQPDVNAQADISLVKTWQEDLEFHEMLGGPATVSFERSPADPIYQLEPAEIIGGVYVVGSLKGPYGEEVERFKGRTFCA